MEINNHETISKGKKKRKKKSSQLKFRDKINIKPKLRSFYNN